MAVLVYYVMSSTRSAGLFAPNKAKPSSAAIDGQTQILANARGHSAGDFDLAIQPKFTAENVKKSLPPFLYSSLLLMILLVKCVENS